MSWKKRLVAFLALTVFAIPFFAQAENAKEVKVKAPAATVARVKRVYTAKLAENGFKPEDLEVIAMGQSHIDAAWLWRWRQTRDYKCPKTFKSALLHFQQFPEFTFHQSAPLYYEWIKETRPEMFKQIVEAEKKGQWLLVGGMWVEPDCNMPEGESFVRQNLYGQRFFLENFGHISDVSWLLDSFGYNWNLPQIVAKSGQKYMWTNKLTWNTHNVFPFHLFWWQSPDGSKVLTHITPAVGGPSFFPFPELASAGVKDFLLAPVGTEGVNFNRNKYKETRYLLKPGESLTADYLTPPANIVSKLSAEFMGTVGIFYGIGDGGHGPIRPEIEQQEAMEELGFAKIGTADQLFSKLEKYSERIPVWDDEMYLEYHQGVMTTHEWIKRANRGAEAILRSAEAVSSAAFLLGEKYPAAELLNSWKLALLNQFHDILPGSSIPDVYEDAKLQYTEIQNQSRKLIDDRIDFLAAKIKMAPPEGAQPVMVYNPLGWSRSDVVKLAINAGDKYQVFTAGGRELPSQSAKSEDGGDYLYFIPDSLPALGWKVFYLKNGESSALAGPAVKEEGDRILVENELVRVAVCKKSGLLVSLYDKRLQREFIKRPSNKILAFVDKPKEYPAWNIADNYLTRPIAAPGANSVTVQAKGPAFARILVERKAEPTSFKQWLTVYSGSPMVEMITYTDMHWKETLVKLEFNTAVETEKVAADIPYAVIERSTHPQVEWDKARTEMPVQKWSDLSDENSGIALLNFGKYGFSLNEDGGGWRLSIVKAAVYAKPRLGDRGVNVLYQTLATLHTDQGDHWAQTALFPHKGGWQQGKVSKAAYQYNTPAIAKKVSAGKGDLSPEASLLWLESPSAYIASVKKAEDDDGLVVRVVGESADTSAVLKVHSNFRIAGAEETDLLEFNPKPLKHDGKSVAFPVGHFEIKTIKLKLTSK